MYFLALLRFSAWFPIFRHYYYYEVTEFQRSSECFIIFVFHPCVLLCMCNKPELWQDLSAFSLWESALIYG